MWQDKCVTLGLYDYVDGGYELLATYITIIMKIIPAVKKVFCKFVFGKWFAIYSDPLSDFHQMWWATTNKENKKQKETKTVHGQCLLR